MPKIRSLFGKIGSLFKKKPRRSEAARLQRMVAADLARRPKPRRKLGEAFGGAALGSREEGKLDLSPENVAKWRTLPQEMTEAFVFDQVVFPVHSTNVAAAQYLAGTRQMIVEFLGDGHYLYSNVSEAEAIDFAKAGSKGGWVWDVLRVRGTKWGHKKPYQKVGGFLSPKRVMKEEVTEPGKPHLGKPTPAVPGEPEPQERASLHMARRYGLAVHGLEQQGRYQDAMEKWQEYDKWAERQRGVNRNDLQVAFDVGRRGLSEGEAPLVG